MSGVPPSADPGLRGVMARLGRDVGYNSISLVAVALCGLGLNLVIGRVYGAATLGVFNQVVAAFVLFGQAAAGGINDSVLRAVAGQESEAERRRIITGGLLLTVATGALVSLLFWLAGPVAARLLDSPGVATGMAVAAPGLFCFALNKTLLGVVNGLRRMRAFAAYQASRYLLLLAALGLAWARDTDGDLLAGIFTVGEATLCGILLVELAGQGFLRPGRGWRPWAARHLRYGLKSILAGTLMELNARVDVLMLGLFVGDREVGVYSLAAFTAEGVYQLYFVLQNNLNPLLAAHLARRDQSGLEDLVRGVRRWMVPAMVAVCALAALAYPWTLPLWAGGGSFAESSWPFALLAAGLALGSPYLPFFKMLLMANRPGWHTIFMGAIVATNVVANALLIPTWGIVGAAAATGLSLALSGLALRAFVRRRVGFPL